MSRSTYAALFAIIGTLYGAGDGSTTFNLPNLNGRFIEGSNTSGTAKSAGLPNHSHYFTTVFSLTQFVGGQGSSNDFVRPANVGSANNWVSYAHESHSIYGASSTVQPPALTMRFYIKF